MENQRRDNFKFIEVDGKKFRIGKFTPVVAGYLIFNFLPKVMPFVSMFLNSEAENGIANFIPFANKEIFEKYLLDMLSVVQLEHKAGFLPIIDEGGSLDLELADDSFLVLYLAGEALKFNGEDFFLEKNQKLIQNLLQGLTFYKPST